MNDREQWFWIGWVSAVVAMFIMFCAMQSASGQTPATYGYTSDGKGGWTALQAGPQYDDTWKPTKTTYTDTIVRGEVKGISDASGWRSAEYQLAQRCPSGSPNCGGGISIGAGIGIERWQTPPRVQPRPQQPSARLPAIAAQVTVLVRVPDSTGASVGSGVVIGTNLVLTAYHVVRESQGTIQVGNGISATIIAHDVVWDLALLRTTHPFGTCATLANYRPAIGERLFSGGYANGGPLHWTVGPVTGYNSPMQRNEPDWLVVVSGNRSGDSGGPIFNASGQVVGICWGAVDNQARATVCTRIWQVFGQWLSASAPAGQSPPATNADPDGGAAGAAGNGGAGANAEAWATKLADSIDSLRAEIASIKARDATVIKQEVNQAVTVQAENVGRQLIDKELVPLRTRIDLLESAIDSRFAANEERTNEHAGALSQLTLQQQALELAVAAGGGKGDRGEPGLPGQDATVNMEELVELLRPLVVADLQKTDDVPRKPDEWQLPQKPVYYDIRPRRSGG